MQVTLGLGSSSVRHGRVQPELTYLPEPAVATGFTYELSTAYNEWPIALAFTLTSDDNVAARQVSLQLLDPAGNLLSAVPVASTQAASLTYSYTFASWLSNPAAAAADVVISPFFAFVVPAAYQIVMGIANVQVGDQVSQALYYRDRYSTGPDGYPQGGFNLPGLEAWETAAIDQG